VLAGASEFVAGTAFELASPAGAVLVLDSAGVVVGVSDVV